MLEFHQVTKFYSAPHMAEGSLKALDKISFEVAKGDFVAIIGPSGCGKSTLLRLASGLELADEGSLHFGGSPITGVSADRTMMLPITGPSADRSLMFQQDSIFPWLTVFENAAFALRDRICREPALRLSVDEMLEQVGLRDFANAYPHQLSGGMRQRLALVRALAVRPRLLLLDEPFGAVDALVRLQLQRMLGDMLESSHTTAMLVTHDVEEALSLANRILILSKRPGRVLDQIKGGLLDTPWRSRQRSSAPFQELRMRLIDKLDTSELVLSPPFT